LRVNQNVKELFSIPFYLRAPVVVNAFGNGDHFGFEFGVADAASGMPAPPPRRAAASN
jgi:hypothetical protein